MTTMISVDIHFDPADVSHKHHPADDKCHAYGTLKIGYLSAASATLYFGDTADIDAVIAALVALKQEMDPPVITENWPPAVVSDGQLAAAIISVSDRVPIENLGPFALAKRLIAAMVANEPVITDSERDCNEVNGGEHCTRGGEHCTRGGDHGVHRDSNGDEWRTDAPSSVQQPAPVVRVTETAAGR